MLQRSEHWLLQVPVFRTIYAPVKQLVVGVLARQRDRVQARGAGRADPARGCVLGFLTREFTLDRGAGAGAAGGGVRADQPPLSGRRAHLRAASERRFPDITVEEGIRIFLTGGMALPATVQSTSQSRRLGHARSRKRGATRAFSLSRACATLALVLQASRSSPDASNGRIGHREPQKR